MKKKSKTTLFGAIAAAAFLISHPESPVKDSIPESVKSYASVATMVTLALLGKTAADETAPPK